MRRKQMLVAMLAVAGCASGRMPHHGSAAEHDAARKRDVFRQYMKIRKEEGYKTPKGER